MLRRLGSNWSVKVYYVRHIIALDDMLTLTALFGFLLIFVLHTSY